MTPSDDKPRSKRRTSKSIALTPAEIKQIANKAEKPSAPIISGKAQRQELFLSLLSIGHSLSKAANGAGIVRSTVYLWLQDDVFKRRYDDAYADSTDNLVDVGYERATRQSGGSDVLLMFMIKARLPEYKEGYKPPLSNPDEATPINDKLNDIRGKLEQIYKEHILKQKMAAELEAMPSQRLVDVAPRRKAGVVVDAEVIEKPD